MAIREITKLGDAILREKAKPVTVFDDKLGILIDDMIETMFAAEGVGLAAPQISILRQICVISIDNKKVYELINPQIVETSGTQQGTEGCLSIPNQAGIVERPQQITVKYQNRKGKYKEITVSDFLAVAFCHEIDHLNGILFIDKLIKSE